MKIKLYVVHGSHPCAAVARALELKRLDYDLREWPPVLHVPIQRLLFGARTVPAITIDGERISGSRQIMRRLDEIAPEPPLLPRDPEHRARVEEVERWGDEVFQPIGRTLIWPAMLASPGAAPSYSEHSRLAMPAAALRASIPLIGRIASRINGTDADAAARALAELPSQLDRIDGYIAEGTIGAGEHPNAADLQLGSTLRLMLTLGDVAPLIDQRPCGHLALSLFPNYDGRTPAGSIRAPASSLTS